MAMKVEPEELKQHNNYIIRVKASIPNYGGLEGREKFLADRRLGIGGSDVAAILGKHPHRTALDVWAEKTGRKEPEDLSSNETVHFGIELEDVIAKEYAKRTKQNIRRVNQPIICNEQPWLRANLDRRVTGVVKPIEIKNTGSDVVRYGKEWGEGNKYKADDQGKMKAVIICGQVPRVYFLQCLHYMVVTGAKEADLAVLIGGNQYRDYTLNYNEQLANVVCQRLKDFWFNHVIADVSPEPQRNSDVDLLHPLDDGGSVTANDETLEDFKKLKTLKAQIEALETEAYGPKVSGKRLGGVDLKIKKFMGDNTLLINTDGQKLCSWKTQTTSRIDTNAIRENEPVIAAQNMKETTSRVLRT